MSDDATPNDNVTDVTDANATDDNVNADDKGAGNEDDAPTESDGGFADFLDDVLGDDPVDAGDDTTVDDPKDDKDTKKETDDVIDVDDVLADDQGDDAAQDVVADTTTDKVDPKDAQIAVQANQINQLMSMIKDSNKPPEPEPEPEVDIFEDESFSNLAEMLDVDDDGKKALQTFFTKLVEHTQKSSVKEMLNATPDMIGKVMDSKTQIENVKTKFYAENVELAALKPFVKELASAIAQENPTMDMGQVLEETSKKAYKVLGITKKKPDNDDKKGKGGDDNPDAGGDKGKRKPAFSNANNVRKPPVKTTKLDGDLDAMLKTLD